jgi:hypothetical protein
MAAVAAVPAAAGSAGARKLGRIPSQAASSAEAAEASATAIAAARTDAQVNLIGPDDRLGCAVRERYENAEGCATPAASTSLSTTRSAAAPATTGRSKDRGAIKRRVCRYTTPGASTSAARTGATWSAGCAKRGAPSIVGKRTVNAARASATVCAGPAGKRVEAVDRTIRWKQDGAAIPKRSAVESA